MNPIWWTTLFLLFILILLVVNALNYFFKNVEITNNNIKNNSLKSFNWKW